MNPAWLNVAVLPWGPEARSKGRARASSLTGEPWKGQKLSMASPPILVIDSSLSVRVNLQHALMQDALSRGDQQAWKAAMEACVTAIGKLGRLAFP